MTDQPRGNEPAEFGEIYDSLLASLPEQERDNVSDLVARYRQSGIDETKNRTTWRHPTTNDGPDASAG